ncbi:hypothetical protein BJ742DRAFT_894759 [Cladochytrium replicatum]|nr:hypothetical protein BJ742DRAFT_894759 [Cladochytrium replicatum]
MSRVNDAKTTLEGWHHRLGHVGNDRIKLLLSLADGRTMMPFEAATGHGPNLRWLRKWGCLACVHKPTPSKKLDDRSTCEMDNSSPWGYVQARRSVSLALQGLILMRTLLDSVQTWPSLLKLVPDITGFEREPGDEFGVKVVDCGEYGCCACRWGDNAAGEESGHDYDTEEGPGWDARNGSGTDRSKLDDFRVVSAMPGPSVLVVQEWRVVQAQESQFVVAALSLAGRREASSHLPVDVFNLSTHTTARVSRQSQGMKDVTSKSMEPPDSKDRVIPERERFGHSPVLAKPLAIYVNTRPFSHFHTQQHTLKKDYTNLKPIY